MNFLFLIFAIVHEQGEHAEPVLSESEECLLLFLTFVLVPWQNLTVFPGWRNIITSSGSMTGQFTCIRMTCRAFDFLSLCISWWPRLCHAFSQSSPGRMCSVFTLADLLLVSRLSSRISWVPRIHDKCLEAQETFKASLNYLLCSRVFSIIHIKNFQDLRH